MENYTTFYKENYDEHLGQCHGIITLNIGDRFTDKKGDMYEVVWKLLNVEDMIMIYHGRYINGYFEYTAKEQC